MENFNLMNLIQRKSGLGPRMKSIFYWKIGLMKEQLVFIFALSIFSMKKQINFIRIIMDDVPSIIFFFLCPLVSFGFEQVY